MLKQKNKNRLYDSLFLIYILFLLTNNYYFFQEVANPGCLANYFPAGDREKLHPFILNTGKIVSSIKEFEIHNLIFNFLTCFVRDNFFAFNFTPTVILVICLFFIYQLGSHESKIYGLLTVLFFSSFPITVTYSKYNMCHLGETMYLLAAVYFYLKSENFRENIYTALYAIAVVFIVLRRGSGIIYALILFILNFYFLLQQKNKRIRKIQWGILSVIFILVAALFIQRLEYFRGYVSGKLSVSVFFNRQSMIENVAFLIKYLSYELPHKLYRHYFYTFYFWLILCLLSYNLFFKNRIRKKNERDIINTCLIVTPLVIHLMTAVPPLPHLPGVKSVLEDIFPVFAFLSLKIGTLLFRLRQRLQINSSQSFWLTFLNKEIVSYFLILILLLHSLSLVLPYREGDVLTKIHNIFADKKVLYISKQNKSFDVQLNNTQSSILHYVQLNKKAIKTLIIRIYNNPSILVDGHHFCDYLRVYGFQSEYLNIFLDSTEPFKKAKQRLLSETKYIDFKKFDSFVFIYDDISDQKIQKIFNNLENYKDIIFSSSKTQNFILGGNCLRLYFSYANANLS